MKERGHLAVGDGLPTAADAFQAHRAQLLALAAKHLDPALSRRLSPEDVVQETFAAAMKRMDFLSNAPEVPLYFKLRTLLFQTLADIARRHLAAQKRSARMDADPPGHHPDGTASVAPDWDMLAGTATAPNSALAREDRHALLRSAIAHLPAIDRQIILLRHFDGLDNADCARILGIQPKAASIRHARALARLHARLELYSEFKG